MANCYRLRPTRRPQTATNSNQQQPIATNSKPTANQQHTNSKNQQQKPTANQQQTNSKPIAAHKLQTNWKPTANSQKQTNCKLTANQQQQQTNRKPTGNQLQPTARLLPANRFPLNRFPLSEFLVHPTSAYFAPNRAMDMHPEGIDLHPKVGAYMHNEN